MGYPYTSRGTSRERSKPGMVGKVEGTRPPPPKRDEMALGVGRVLFSFFDEQLGEFFQYTRPPQNKATPPQWGEAQLSIELITNINIIIVIDVSRT